MKIRMATIGGLVALMAAMPASALARSKHHKPNPKPTYYLALGDSLAAGAQPNTAGVTVPTKQGYANDLYAAESKKIKNLKFEDIGCLGETTTSMIKGGKFCKYKGAQLTDAVKFIKSHKIAFITLDIGANDVDGCVTGGSIEELLAAGGQRGHVRFTVPRHVLWYCLAYAR
jgi:lysophospholipase L1-like esterase